MADAKHSPEPWVGGNSTNTGAHELIGDGQQLIALVYDRNKEEQDANLALLATAPDLMATLDHLLSFAISARHTHARSNAGFSEAIAAARAAIAKATGAA